MEKQLLVDNDKQWVKTVVNTGSSIIGMIVMYTLKKTAMVFSTCALGATLVVDATQSLIDPILSSKGVATLKSNPVASTSIRTALMALAVVAALKPGGNNIPLIIKPILAPFYAIEIFVEKTLKGK